MAQTKAQNKIGAPFHPLTAQEAKEWYEKKFLTTAGYLFALKCIIRPPGVELRIPNVLEFCREWGVSKSAFYRALDTLEEGGWMEWETTGEVVLRNKPLSSKPPKVVQLCVPRAGHHPTSGTPSHERDTESHERDTESHERDTESHERDSDIYKERARAQTLTDISDIYREEDPAHENLASPSEPKEAIAPSTVTSFSCSENLGHEAKHAEEGQGSAAPLQNSKIPPPRDFWAERCDQPGHRYPQLAAVGLSHIWVGPSLLGFVPELVEACCRHLKKHDRPCEYGDGQQYLSNRIRKEDWAAIELRVQEMERYLGQQITSQSSVVAPPAAAQQTETNANPFGLPVTTGEEIQRIRGMVLAAKAAGRPLSALVAKRAAELGVELDVAIAQPVEPVPEQVSVTPAQPSQAIAPLGDLLTGIKPTPPEPSEELDFADIKAEIQVQCMRLTWAEADLDEFVQEKFGKRNTQYLEDEQLLDLLNFLKREERF